MTPEREDDVFLSLVRLGGDIEVAELSADMERRYMKMASTQPEKPPPGDATAD
jgi:hypothetical protein